MEPKVILKCRKTDVALVESVVPEAVKAYTDATRQPCSVSISKDSYLADDV